MGKKRAIIIVLLATVVVGGGAMYLKRGGSASSGAELVRTTNAGASASGRSATSTDSLVAEITATIYQIDRLQLDPSIFNSAAFRVLRDGTQIIPPEVPGRDNPFAPLYSDGLASSTIRSSRPSGSGGLLNLTVSGTGATSSVGLPPPLPTR